MTGRADIARPPTRWRAPGTVHDRQKSQSLLVVAVVDHMPPGRRLLNTKRFLSNRE